MKRILIALAMLAAVQVADAQVKSPDAAAKAVEKAEVASQDPKKAPKVATWTKLAQSYVDAYNAPAGNAMFCPSTCSPISSATTLPPKLRHTV